MNSEQTSDNWNLGAMIVLREGCLKKKKPQILQIIRSRIESKIESNFMSV